MCTGSKNHHYIPVFYLKQWAGPNGEICEFSRKHHKVKPHSKHPRGAGYERDLYTIPNVPPELAYAMEDKFLKKADQLASDALNLLLQSKVNELDLEGRSAWSRFIMSLIHRNPEKVAWVKERWKVEFNRRMAEIEKDYANFRPPNFPDTFEELKEKIDARAYEKSAALFLQTIIDTQRVGTFINQMRWSVVTFDNLPYPLLTSDRPVIMTDGLKHNHSHIAVPMSPKHLFVAVNNIKTENWLKGLKPQHLAQSVNDRVASQASQYVYGTNDRQLCFVENRLGKAPPQFIGAKG